MRLRCGRLEVREVLPVAEKEPAGQVIPEPVWYAVQRIDGRLERMETSLSGVREDVAALKQVTAGFAGLPAEVGGLKQAVVSVEAGLDKLGQRVASVEAGLDKLGQRVDAVEARVAGVERKIDFGFAQVDARFAQVDARFAQLKTELGGQVLKVVGVATGFLTVVIALLAWLVR